MFVAQVSKFRIVRRSIGVVVAQGSYAAHWLIILQSDRPTKKYATMTCYGKWEWTIVFAITIVFRDSSNNEQYIRSKHNEKVCSGLLHNTTHTR